MKLTEEQVKQLMNVDSLENLPIDKLPAFVSTIPMMDKETAMKCIEQFPDFRNYSIEIVRDLTGLYREALDKNNEAFKINAGGYTLVLNDLSRQLNREGEYTSREKLEIMDKEVTVADRLAEATKDNRHFLEKIVGTTGAITAAALAVGATFLGGGFFKRR